MELPESNIPTKDPVQEELRMIVIMEGLTMLVESAASGSIEAREALLDAVAQMKASLKKLGLDDPEAVFETADEAFEPVPASPEASQFETGHAPITRMEIMEYCELRDRVLDAVNMFRARRNELVDRLADGATFDFPLTADTKVSPPEAV